MYLVLACGEREMIEFARKEILRLTKNEIEIGFVFLDRYAVSHGEPAADALGNAILAYDTATYLIGRLSPDEGDSFRPRLNELADALRSKGQEHWKGDQACDGPTESGMSSPYAQLVEDIYKRLQAE